MFSKRNGQSFVLRGTGEVSPQMSFSLWALMTWDTSVFFVSFPWPIMPKFFASGQISSLAFNSAQGLPNMPVGLPSLSIATESKSALEQSGAGAGGEERSLSEEEISRSGVFGVLVSVPVVVGGRKVPADAGGRVATGGTKVAVDARVAVDAGGGGRVAVEFVVTALMMSSVG